MTTRRLLVAVAVLVALVGLAVLLAAAEGDGPGDCGGWFALDGTAPASTGTYPAAPPAVRALAAALRKPPVPGTPPKTKKPAPAKPPKPKNAHHHGGGGVDADTCD